MANYYAEIYLGVTVTKADFFETDTVVTDCQEDGCPLEVPPDAEFCSKCGKRSSEKTSRVAQDMLHPHLEEFNPFDDFDEDDEYTWDDLLTEYEPEIHGLRLMWLQTSSEDHDPPAFLGIQLARVPGSSGWGGDENPTSIDTERVSDDIARVASRLLDLGFDPDRAPKLHIICYCSV